MESSQTIVTVSLNPAIDRTLEVEEFTLGAHQVGREIVRTPGGKGVNVSRVLATLGVRNIATGFLGADNREEFAPALDNPLLGDEFFTIRGRTRENITIVDRATSTETHIRNPGLEVPERDLKRLGTKLGLLSRKAAIVAFCGSLPPGVSVEAFCDLVDTCLTGFARVVVDTNGPALQAMGSRRLWLLKPNARELGELVGRDLPDLASQQAAARELTETVEIVIVTRGEHGAMLFTGDLALTASVDIGAQRVQNTVGCGDTMLGAFIAGHAAGESLAEAFASAVATATAAACHPATARFDPELLAELRERVTVESVT
jgi:1-phosphofructokinase